MGNALSQSFPPRPRWTARDIPDLSGKVALVTGANTGIGKETAKELLAHGAKVYVAARSRAKAEAAIADLKIATGRTALFLELDLGDLVSVKRAAEAFLAQESTLHILVASAGVMAPPVEQLTSQGLDLQFGTNVLGHWYFIQQLLLPLTAAAGARVVILASLAADLAGPIQWDAFEDTPARRALGTQGLYLQSKLFDVIITREFARRNPDSGIIFSSLNPGNIKTDLQRHVSWIQKKILDLMLYSVEYGALTSLYAATGTDAIVNGAYYIPWARVGKTPKQALDNTAGPRFWEWAERQVEKI